MQPDGRILAPLAGRLGLDDRLDEPGPPLRWIFRQAPHQDGDHHIGALGVDGCRGQDLNRVAQSFETADDDPDAEGVRGDVDVFAAVPGRDAAPEAGPEAGGLLVDAGRGRHARPTVHDLDVGEVDGVLQDELRVQVDRLEAVHGVGPERVVRLLDGFGHRGRFPARPRARGVMPQVDQSVGFRHRPGDEPLGAVHPPAVGDVDIPSGGVEAPAVERAHHVVTADRAAVAQVGAEVRAERVEHVHRAGVPR